MKKIFTNVLTLSILIFLAVGSLKAASYIPEETKVITENTVIYSTDSDISSAGTSTASWVVIPSNSTSNVRYTNTNGDSDGNPDNLSDNLETTPGNVAMVQIKADGNVYNSSKRVIHMNVQGISGFIAHGATSSAGRGMQVSVNKAEGLTETSDMNVVASVVRPSVGSFIVGYAELDPEENYILSIYSAEGDARFYAIEFISGPASPYISSFSVGGVDAVIDNEAETITAELPYGIGLTDLTPVVGLGGSAKSYSPAGSQDFTNSVVYSVYESEDASGTAAKTYTVTLTAATSLSSDASLSDIKVDGTTIQGFNAETFTYNIDLPLGTNDVPVVSYTLSDARANAEQHDAVSLPGATTIVVTAEDGETTQTYTINFMVDQAPLPATVLTVSETAAIDEAGWAQTENFYSVSENTIVFNAYTAYQSIATQTWVAVDGSGSTVTSWDATGIFKGSTYYGQNSDSVPQYRAATTRNDRIYSFAVANCVSASVLVKPGSSSIEVVLYAYEIQSGGLLVLANSVTKTGSTDIAAMTISDLDKTKEYVIVLTSNSSSNTNFYEIAFEYPDSGSGTNIIGNTTIDNITFNGQTIFNPENVSLEVYDTTGRMVARSSENIDMSAMKGVFIVKSQNASLKIAVTK